MNRQTRLIFLALSLLVLVVIGRLITGDFDFLLDQFWFASGILLLLLLSLVDQPYFSKDSNIFANGITAWVSLLLVPEELRGAVWWSFLTWAGYLIFSSYLLMWLRRRELSQEPPYLQGLARVNRVIGRPEAIFSALFIWGVALQFGANSAAAGALFLFWAAFMILNLPVLASALNKAFARRTGGKKEDGILEFIVSPRVAHVTISIESTSSVVGRSAEILSPKGQTAARAVVIDDRIVAGRRIARLVLTETTSEWRRVAEAGGKSVVRLSETPNGDADASSPISFVDVGSEIGKLVFRVPPELNLQSGEIVSTIRDAGAEAYYQVISAVVREEQDSDRNALHEVKVTAGELGEWNATRSRFEPITWVAPAGQLIRRVTRPTDSTAGAPPGSVLVGNVPNSAFPVHVVLEEVVTHNTALIGVTGSGKSFLAFHLIEAIAASGVRVLVLDVSRQHDLYLSQRDPTPLKVVADVAPWLAGNSMIGIHQFAAASGGIPKATADFTTAAFDEMAKALLERGKNLPARLCIVFEEAHSLIPEWNQVAQEGDKQQVNRTARALLQGRKYGMGALVISQRTANVTKTILNQCNTIFALQSFDQTGLDFLRNYMGEEYSHAISTLPFRHAILVGKASSSTRPLLVEVVDMADRWQPDVPRSDGADGDTEAATGTEEDADIDPEN